jgi:hypothetical protein
MNTLEKCIHQIVGGGTCKKGGWLYENLPKILDLIA